MVHVLWAPGSIKVVKQCLANKKWVIYSFTAGYIGKLVQRYYGTNSHVSTVTVMSYPITLPYFSSFLIYALVLKVCRTPILFKDVYNMENKSIIASRWPWTYGRPIYAWMLTSLISGQDGLSYIYIYESDSLPQVESNAHYFGTEFIVP